MADRLGVERVDQAAYWNGAVGERWVAQQAALDTAFAALTDAAMTVAAPSPGERVLDIGCGTGATVLALARRVGPAGHVLGVDISRPMLALAAERLREANLAHATAMHADASRPLAQGPFDLAFSRFGVMFFDDPAAAFATIRAALAPGGRLAFACWRPLAENQWFRVPSEPILALLPVPPPPTDPLAPGPLALADPFRVRSVLDAAGFAEVAVRGIDAPVVLGPVDDATALLSQVGPASRALAEAGPEQRPVLLSALATTIAAHAGADGVVRLGGAIWAVTARRDP